MDDACYTCTGYGDDYRYDAETDEWISNCPECPYNPGRRDDEGGKRMTIQTLDGIEIFCLPENARCDASDGFESPEELEECPLGYEACIPETCRKYIEI